MLFRYNLSVICIAISLTACGGGNSDPTQSAPVASAASADLLPQFRAKLQAFEATTPALLAPTFLSSVVTVGAPSNALAFVDGAGAINDRAMWTWYDSDISTTSRQNKMLDFAVARKVNNIFIHAQTLLDKPTLLAGFLNRAAARGIKVELLFGAAEWALTANHSKPLDLLNRANAFVAGLTGARPAGIHFDIEPHALPEWQTDPVSLGNQLVDLYEKLAYAKGAGSYVNADIAMGYEYVSLTRGGVTKTLSQWMVDATDRTTLMDYRDYSSGEDSIESHANHPIACVFRAKLDTHSTTNWTPGPAQTGHAFHGKLDTQSSANWTPVPLQTGQFEAA